MQSKVIATEYLESLKLGLYAVNATHMVLCVNKPNEQFWVLGDCFGKHFRVNVTAQQS